MVQIQAPQLMIYIAADNHGFKAITFVEEYLKSHNLPYVNLGVKNQGEDLKLEEMIPQLAKKVKENENNFGILSCGTGVGVEVGANRFSGIRACLATTPRIAEWSRIYDKSNVLCLVGWETDKKIVYDILDAWFRAEYDGDKNRLEMMKAFDRWH